MTTNPPRDTPHFSTFDPRVIPWQYKVIYDMNKKIDWAKGRHDFLFSGTIGSAKSCLLAFIAVHHVLKNKGARALIGRLTMPDLKDTLIQDIHDMLEGDFTEGVDFEFNQVRQEWIFTNGSNIITRSWHRKNFKQFRSLKLSFAGIEEITENRQEYWPFFDELKQRVGRCPGIEENLVCAATNPDTSAHPCYKYFMVDGAESEFRHVYYSDARDNPFLPDWYIPNLMEDLSPLEVQRMIEGKWVDDPKGGIYYNYLRERNFRPQPYIYDLDHEIALAFDFNIAKNAPMSSCTAQHIGGVFHFGHAFHVESADTHEILQEMAEVGIFEKKTMFAVYGDASGNSRDTRSKTTDYDIIKTFLQRYVRKDGSRLQFTMKVPRSNPPLRKRHNICNAKFANGNGITQCYVYKEADWLDQGFRLTRLKDGAKYLEHEDQTQHCTTAAGYYIVRKLANVGQVPYHSTRR